MKILISPAKSLDFEKKVPTQTFSTCAFLTQSKKINSILQLQKPADLATLMNISDALANLNYQRNQVWTTPFSLTNARQAIFAFNGDVYSGLDAYTLNENQHVDLQNKVRILSGLYGILKPLDLMQPYRLEMGTKIAIGESKNLYDFWKPKITVLLNKELVENELFVNLASTEYFSAIDTKLLKVSVITPEFKDFKNGKLKIISFFAKRARGLMLRYILDHNIETLDGLKSFNIDNYCFDEALSNGNRLVFTR